MAVAYYAAVSISSLANVTAILTSLVIAYVCVAVLNLHVDFAYCPFMNKVKNEGFHFSPVLLPLIICKTRG